MQEPGTSRRRIRVLVVDDSGFVIAAVTRRLESDPGIEVVGSARNGVEALEQVKRLEPDVITLDVVMPEMDGLEALKRIMAAAPTPVVMLSALTDENREITLRALDLGAVDFFLKTSVVNPAGDSDSARSLIEKVRAAATARLGTGKPAPALTRGGKPEMPRLNHHAQERVVVIGCSTGGPRALMELLPALPPDLPAAVLVVQHMPPMFTESLAQRLDRASGLRVSQAAEGSPIVSGEVLLAPGGYHMVCHEGKVELTLDAPVHGVRPSVDVAMKSAARSYGAACLGVILTGMGSDGTEGAGHIKAAGGETIAQDESTSAVFGMPYSVLSAGFADRVMPLPQIAGAIARICQESVRHEYVRIRTA